MGFQALTCAFVIFIFFKLYFGGWLPMVRDRTKLGD